MSHQTVIVLDFGGQYNQLIARRVRECGVYCEVKPYTTSMDDIRAADPIGIIFTGGPNSVYLDTAPRVDPEIFTWGVPILGICYGCQLMAQSLGGAVTAAQDDAAREYGKTKTYYDTGCKLFRGLPEEGISWMSHGDYMAKVPAGFSLTAHSDACPNVAIADEVRGFYGVQFHPEVNHTENGIDMIRNFLYEVCHAAGDWTMEDYCKTAIEQVRRKIGDGKVLLALSGGVDSSVVAALLAEAVGNQLAAVANTQDGNAQGKQGRVRLGGFEIVDTVGAAGEDDADGVHGLQFRCGGGIGLYFAVNAAFPDPTGNQLIVLTAEVQDDDCLMGQGDSSFMVDSGYETWQPPHSTTVKPVRVKAGSCWGGISTGLSRAFQAMNTRTTPSGSGEMVSRTCSV